MKGLSCNPTAMNVIGLVKLGYGIALTARSSGATVITSNRANFELIQSYKDFNLEIW